MKALNKTVYLYAQAPAYGDEVDYYVSGNENLAVSTFGRVVASASVEFTVPDLNPTALAIEQLEAEKAKAADDFRRTMQIINERLAKLQAITNEVPA